MFYSTIHHKKNLLPTLVRFNIVGPSVGSVKFVTQKRVIDVQEVTSRNHKTNAHHGLTIQAPTKINKLLNSATNLEEGN
jgi:hypothetical protein